MEVPDFRRDKREKGLNVEKCLFSQGLSKDFFQLAPDTLEPPPPRTFSDQINLFNLKKHQEISENCIFGQILNISLIFDPLPLPILGLSSKSYCTPLPPDHYRS